MRKRREVAQCGKNTRRDRLVETRSSAPSLPAGDLFRKTRPALSVGLQLQLRLQLQLQLSQTPNKTDEPPHPNNSNRHRRKQGGAIQTNPPPSQHPSKHSEENGPVGPESSSGVAAGREGPGTAVGLRLESSICPPGPASAATALSSVKRPVWPVQRRDETDRRRFDRKVYNGFVSLVVLDRAGAGVRSSVVTGWFFSNLVVFLL